MSAIRTPAVAGLFYPANPRQLAHGAQEMLSKAGSHDLTHKSRIVPHIVDMLLLASVLGLGALAVFIYIVLVAIKHNPLPFFHSAPDIARKSVNKKAW